MDFMFLNAVIASPVFPPNDPWLAGEAVSYYYFGYWMIGALTLLSGPGGAGRLQPGPSDGGGDGGSGGVRHRGRAGAARRRLAGGGGGGGARRRLPAAVRKQPGRGALPGAGRRGRVGGLLVVARRREPAAGGGGERRLAAIALLVVVRREPHRPQRHQRIPRLQFRAGRPAPPRDVHRLPAACARRGARALRHARPAGRAREAAPPVAVAVDGGALARRACRDQPVGLADGRGADGGGAAAERGAPRAALPLALAARHLSRRRIDRRGAPVLHPLLRLVRGDGGRACCRWGSC